MTDREQKLLEVFRRALRSNADKQAFVVGELAAWDSLTHIKLIMELEMAFGIRIGPDDIPELYQDFETVSAYLEKAL